MDEVWGLRWRALGFDTLGYKLRCHRLSLAFPSSQWFCRWRLLKNCQQPVVFSDNLLSTRIKSQ